MNHNIRKMAYLTFFIALEIIISIVPFLGFVPLGFINATTLHISVILAGILLGKKEGALLGFVFGFLSMLKATFEPNMTSFLFSPFFSMNGISGNFISIIIAFLPRILLGYFSGLLYNLFKDKNQNLAIVIASFSASMINTILVLSLAYIFFKEAYALTLNIDINLVFSFILTLVFTSGIIESLLAVFMSMVVVKMSKKVIRI